MTHANAASTAIARDGDFPTEELTAQARDVLHADTNHGMPGALDRGHRFTLQGVAISFQLDIDKEPIGAVAMRCPERFARERN